MLCPNCNAVVNDTQAFCENCGASLAEYRSSQDAGYGEAPNAGYEVAPSTSYNAEPGAAAGYGAAPGAGVGAGGAAGYGTAPNAGYGTAPNAGYGSAPIPPTGYAPAQTPAPSNVPFGLSIAALVCGLIGLFPVGIILAIVALVMNSRQKKSGVVSTKQTPTLVMGIIGLVTSILFMIVTIMLGAVLVAAVESGEFDNYDFEVTPSGSVNITTPSGTSVVVTDDGVSSTSSASSSSASSSTSSSSAQGSLGSTATSVADSVVGVWEIDSLVSSTEEDSFDAEELESMRMLGNNIELIFNEDGTVSLDVFGDVLEGTWSVSGSAITMTIDGDTAALTIDGDMLIMEEDGDKLLFHRAQ